MIRSSEFIKAKGGTAGKPTLSQLRVKLHDGGATVEHLHEGKHGIQASHDFAKGEGEKFMEHLDQHMGPHLGYAKSAGGVDAHSSKTTGGLEAE